MLTNPVIEAMMNRKSIRKYKEREPSDEVIESIVRAGQQAPFAAQLYSLLLSRNKRNLPFNAPLLFTICVDLHKMEVIMAGRNWKMVTNDLSMLLFGIQDASLMAENMVIAAESFGLGSCFLGGAPYRAESIIKEYKLPKRVFPLVQLAMGYPNEDPPVRPRYPMSFCLFEDEYPPFGEETIKTAMAEMDEGYLAQDYYRNLKAKIPMEGDRKETFTYDNYSWTEHISRKWGQWHKSSKGILEQLAKCGLQLPSTDRTE
jgi:FMN reductase (NADPH)